MMREDVPEDVAERGKIVVSVALGDRGYDIDIGSDLLATAPARGSRRIAARRALRRGQRCECRRALSRCAEIARLVRGRLSRRVVVLPPAKRARASRCWREVCDRSARRLASSAAMPSSRLAAASSAISPALPRASFGAASACADPDDAAGPGRFLGRRQDRHRHAARQESDRRVPPAAPGARRSCRARRRCRRASSARAMPRSMKYGLLGDAEFFAWLERELAADLRRRPARLASGDRHELPRQGRHRRGRRARGKRQARAPQSRPHFRPCARSFRRLFRPPAAWRGDRHRHAARFHLLGGEGIVPRIAMRGASSGILRMSACRAKIAEIPGERPSPEQLLELMRQDKKVKGGKLALVLVRGIGKAFVEPDVSPEALRRFPHARMQGLALRK